MEFCFGNIVISLSTITVHILWPITMFDNGFQEKNYLSVTHYLEHLDYIN